MIVDRFPFTGRADLKAHARELNRSRIIERRRMVLIAQLERSISRRDRQTLCPCT